MQVIDTVAAWRKTLDSERSAGRTVGLVPTMGALHAGHASLVAAATAACDTAAVTVFVNPLQFGATEDLASYPRTLEADVALAEANGASFVFAPTTAEMYPQPIQTNVSVAGISARWEGESRPGHFDGVATVVTKLFTQAGPCHAFFGEKDYQQLAVVRRLVADLDLPVEIVGCPTVREADGLAMSSRNVYLTPDERTVAPALYRALQAAKSALEDEGATPTEARAVMHDLITGEPAFQLIYAEPVDADTLEPLTRPGTARLIVAARLGRSRTRLIDNIGARCTAA